MKDARRLNEKISKLGEASPQAGAGQRDILAGSDGLTAVLREIDETILPRRLTLTASAGSIALTAGNRRLISIDQIDGEGLEEVKGTAGLSLTRPDVADLGRLRDAFVTAFGETASILVDSKPPEGKAPSFADGTTAAALASAWGLSLAVQAGDEDSDQDALESFLGKLPGMSRAWLRLSTGKIADDGGDQEELLRLKDFADSADLADLDMLSTSEERRFISIGRAPDDGTCLIFVSDKLDAALLLIPAEKLDNARAAWRKAAS